MEISKFSISHAQSNVTFCTYGYFSCATNLVQLLYRGLACRCCGLFVALELFHPPVQLLDLLVLMIEGVISRDRQVLHVLIDAAHRLLHYLDQSSLLRLVEPWSTHLCSHRLLR